MPKAQYKEKIAISIDPMLLSRIDSTIDNSLIKSRSQAIEVLLGRALGTGVRKAAILLKAEHIPLSLSEVSGKPVILRQLDFLAKNGISKVLILTGPSKNTAALQKLLSKQPLPFEIVGQKAKGTAASIYAARKHFSNEHFVLMSGDTLMDFDLAKMIEKHLASGKLITMGLINSPVAHNYTSVNLEGDTIKELKERKQGISHIINAGIYIVSPSSLKLLAGKKDLVTEVFPKLVKGNEIQGYFAFGNYTHLGERRPFDRCSNKAI